MKIAYIANNFYTISESFIRDLALGMSENHTVKVFADNVLESGIHIEQLSPLQVQFVFKRTRPERLLLICLRSFKKDWTLWQLSRRQNYAEKKLMKHLKEFAPNVIYCDYGTNGVLLTKIAKKLEIPLIVHFHGFDLSSALHNAWYLEGVKQLVRSGTQIVVPSQHMKRLLVIAVGACAQVEVIPCGPDLELAHSFNSQSKAKVPTLCALGRMTAKKNPLALIEAFRLVREKLPTAHLEWVGDGELMNVVKERIEAHGLGKAITLHGALPHARALEVMASSQVFVQHSVTSPDGDQEGLPVAILEAFALEIPVVSTIHSGIPEAVIDGVNGYLVREHDYESMATMIIKALDARLPKSDNAVENSSFSLKGRIEAFEKLMSDILGSSRK